MVTTNEENNNDVEMIPDDDSDVSRMTDKIKKLKEELKKSEAERKEYLDGWQRARADLINYRKDETVRLEDMAKFITVSLVQNILPVLDSFDLAFAHELSKETEKGILLIRSQLLDNMHKYGLEEIRAIGKKFDPEFHESVAEVESDQEEGTIIEEIQKGYTLKGKVIRPARVKIAKKKVK